MSYCEYADGANNNAGLALIPRVPTMQDAVVAMQTPLEHGDRRVARLWQRAAVYRPSDGDLGALRIRSGPQYYDVTATFVFGPPQ